MELNDECSVMAYEIEAEDVTGDNHSRQKTLFFSLPLYGSTALWTLEMFSVS
jgi:hypothetical protein